MNDKQFDALLTALTQLTTAIQDSADMIQSELMILRDEVVGIRDVYAIAHGIETSWDQEARVGQAIKDGSLFEDLESPIGGDA